MIKGESMSPPAMSDLGNSEATGTSRQFGLALIGCFLICEWQGLIGRGCTRLILRNVRFWHKADID
jgi:hypothetical protein